MYFCDAMKEQRTFLCLTLTLHLNGLVVFTVAVCASLLFIYPRFVSMLYTGVHAHSPY